MGIILQLDTEPEYSGAFRVTRSPEHAKKLVEWLVHLPKTLWELASNNLPASEVRNRRLCAFLRVFSCVGTHKLVTL